MVLGFAPLRWMGTRSYGIYLWQTPIAFAVIHEFNLRPVARLVIVAASSVACAAASYALIEKRFLRLKKKLGGAARDTGQMLVV